MKSHMKHDEQALEVD